MTWAPSRQVRGVIKFWLECLQAVTVITGVATAAIAYVVHKDDVRRELEKPYQEKKLQLYLEAARVLAHLSSSPSLEKEKEEARFWELYWGELGFVESSQIEWAMVKFCEKYFKSIERCSRSHPDSQVTAEQSAAIDLARQASKEIRDRWEQ